jgi:hypothetical protein
MKEVALIISKAVPVPNQLQGCLPWISAIKEVTEVLCSVLKALGFHHLFVCTQSISFTLRDPLGERGRMRGRCKTLYPNSPERKNIR